MKKSGVAGVQELQNGVAVFKRATLRVDAMMFSATGYAVGTSRPEL